MSNSICVWKQWFDRKFEFDSDKEEWIMEMKGTLLIIAGVCLMAYAVKKNRNEEGELKKIVGVFAVSALILMAITAVGFMMGE